MPIDNGIVVRICRGPHCGRTAPKLEAAARSHITNRGLANNVDIDHESCFGRCSMGPNIVFERWKNGARNDQAMISLMMKIFHPDLQPEHGVRPSDMPHLIDAHYRAWRRER